MTTDQFCLRWNNFQLNIASALDSLKTDEDLVDVTLSCEGQNVKAHKVVLSACSPYFRGVFKENPCQHPIVILKDVSYDDVSALLSFMYQGEVFITQDRLASFLHTAELLQVRGLTGVTNPFKDTTKVPSGNSSTTLHQPPTVTHLPSYTSTPKYHSTAPVEQLSSSSSYPQSSNSQSQQPLFSSSAEPSQQFQRTTETDTPNHQVSSPQPPAAKRRKAFPRRVSVGGHLSAEETTESQDSEKGKSRLGEEQIGCEVVSIGAAPVKQEPEDESIFEVDATMEEESNPISFSNAEEDVVRMESPSSENTRRMDYYGNVDSVISDDPQQNLKEESLGEGTPILGQHSMLLRSLSGTKQPMIVGDASPSRLSDGTTSTRPVEEGDGDSGPSKVAGGMTPHVPQCGTCPHCGQKYSNQSALKYHVRLVHSDMTNTLCCHLCPRSFAMRDVYKTHMWEKHRQRC